MKRLVSGLAIAVLAYVALALVDTTAAVQALIALPGSAGLVVALWEVLKSRIEHEHRLEEASAANSFVLSATSHMAETAFNKHVEFCEKYVAKTNEGLVILFREGPTKQALNIAGGLHLVRREFILWETRDVTGTLDKFEQALRSIGADEFYSDHLPVGEERSKVVHRIFETFKAVMDIRSVPSEATAEIAIASIIDRLRDHLGVSALTKLRRHYLEEATRRLK